MHWANKHILVLGLGDTGLSAARWLTAQGARVRVYDTRSAPPQLAPLTREIPEALIAAGALQPDAIADFDLIVSSPGIALNSEHIVKAQSLGIPVIGDIELFAQFISSDPAVRVIAITGSNGKSTVTALTGEMCENAGLKTVVAGNIGLPVLDALTQNREVPDVYVLELSSFQLETTYSLNADAATVLNISEDHMDRYVSIRQYADAKARIFQGQGVQIINRQDAYSLGMVRAGRRILSFGLDSPHTDSEWGIGNVGRDAWLMRGREKLIRVAELPLTGMHNALNALAALALCSALDLKTAMLLEALRGFKGLAHRVQFVATIGGVTFYDDSKGTNVGATVAALSGLSQKAVLIAGGDGKGQDFSPLAEPVLSHARGVVLIGRDGPKIAAVLKNKSVPLVSAASLEEAVTLSFNLAQPGDAVLLSPACASFDMFRNYEHRAQVFIDAIAQLNKVAVQ